MVSHASTISRRRRVEVKNQLMASFTNFVNSLGSSTRGACCSKGAQRVPPRSRSVHHVPSLSKSNHSYYENSRRLRHRSIILPNNEISITTTLPIQPIPAPVAQRLWRRRRRIAPYVALTWTTTLHRQQGGTVDNQNEGENLNYYFRHALQIIVHLASIPAASWGRKPGGIQMMFRHSKE